MKLINFARTLFFVINFTKGFEYIFQIQLYVFEKKKRFKAIATKLNPAPIKFQIGKKHFFLF